MSRLNKFILPFFIVLGIVSFLSLEFIFNLKPCKLCTFQRIPYYIGLFLCFLNNKRWVAILFLLNAILAGFHFFVEEGVFSFECITNSNINTIEELKSSLYTQASCSNKAYIFGLRITLLSLFYSLFICTLSFGLAKHFVQKK